MKQALDAVTTLIRGYAFTTRSFSKKHSMAGACAYSGITVGLTEDRNSIPTTCAVGSMLTPEALEAWAKVEGAESFGVLRAPSVLYAMPYKFPAAISNEDWEEEKAWFITQLQPVYHPLLKIPSNAGLILLRDLQNLHDNNGYWNTKGLSQSGEDALDTLLTLFNNTIAE